MLVIILAHASARPRAAYRQPFKKTIVAALSCPIRSASLLRNPLALCSIQVDTGRAPRRSLTRPWVRLKDATRSRTMYALQMVAFGDPTEVVKLVELPNPPAPSDDEVLVA